jgi:hypothetical protein
MVLGVDLGWTCCKGRSRRQTMRRCQERPLPSRAYKDWCLASSDRILRIHPTWEALDRAAREDKPLPVRHLAGSGRLWRRDTRRLGIDAHEISHLRRSLRYAPVVGTSRVGCPVAVFRRRRDAAAAAAQSSLRNSDGVNQGSEILKTLRFDEAHDRGMLVEEIQVVLEEHSDLGETELPHGQQDRDELEEVEIVNERLVQAPVELLDLLLRSVVEKEASFL